MTAAIWLPGFFVPCWPLGLSVIHQFSKGASMPRSQSTSNSAGRKLTRHRNLALLEEARASQTNETAPASQAARKAQDLQPRAGQIDESVTGPREVLRQGELLAWTAGLGAITAEALAERDELSIESASAQLDEAAQRGLLERHAVLVGYPALYTVTRAGRSLARKHADAGGYTSPEGLRSAHVNIKNARHAIACAGVTAALERRYPDCRVIGERELRRDERERGRRLATVDIVGSGGTRSHSPDVVIWPPHTSGERPSLPLAVEVELTVKSKPELIENCRAWARCPYVEAVLYLAETRRIAQKLLDAIDELGVDEMIVVKPLRETLIPQPGFALDDR
jgi:hypothetical protein